ncbi:flavin monoamine oxidase family protein [Microvirga sp. 2MCAF38]|uniref:flavin monoamine oxidase family protein n=1 Tax=Microvirga sp. 2MCAF38 TaxID=3232989 RepID=UPI003F967D3E
MLPVFAPTLTPLPNDPDVVIVGAGTAGIAAARHLIAQGARVAVLEARSRVGGRAVTSAIKGHPLDLGAHWLHNGPINPLVRLARERRERLRLAPQERNLFIDGRPGGSLPGALIGRAFAIADRALRNAARQGPDLPAAKALPSLGLYGRQVTKIHGLISGRPFDQVSLHDVPDMDYGDNFFIAGGLGAYIARLASGLPVALNTPVEDIAWSKEGVRITTSAGTLKARAVVVTTPMAVLQQGVIRFSTRLPEALQNAIHCFTQGVYEHVVLHWPGSPFQGADRLSQLIGGHTEPPGLLSRIDGTPFHFFELDQPHAAHLDGRDADAPARFVRRVLSDHFGHRAIRDLSVCAATTWRHDPWSRASWAVVPPGLVSIRDALKAPVDDRLWFASEALSRAQWGTVGGAWEEGTRVAGEVAERLKIDA